MNGNRRKYSYAESEKRYFVVYCGLHKELTITPLIGKVIQGKEYEVTEKVYNALRNEPDWKAFTR